MPLWALVGRVAHTDTFMQRTKRLYADTRTAETATGSNLDRLNEDLHDVQKIMTKNMEDLLWRGDSLDRTCRDSQQTCRRCRRRCVTNRSSTAVQHARLMWMLWSASTRRTSLRSPSIGAIAVLFLFIVYIRFG